MKLILEKENRVFNIIDFGAIAGTDKLQTEPIQKCIDCCWNHGGGEVVIPSGTFVIGSLRLYSNTTLHLKTGAILLGSKNYKDYKDFKIPSTIQYIHNDQYREKWNLPDYYFYGLITSFETENIKIIGDEGSVIDGRDTFDKNGEEKFRGPMGIVMTNVKNLSLEGYCFQNAANWSHTIDGCTNVTIKNITIKAGHDGFNLHHSNQIEISDCHLECGDDCFAGYNVKHLLVDYCYLNTSCNSMRIGGEYLLFKNCNFSGPGKYPHLSKATHHTHAIFKYYSIRPDTIPNNSHDIQLINCKITDADKLFVYDYGKEELLQNNQPLRDLYLENVQIKDIRETSVFKGHREQAKLILNNVKIDFDSTKIFLLIDESISLDFKQVNFVNPTIIQIASKRKLYFHGLTTFKLFANEETI